MLLSVIVRHSVTSVAPTMDFAWAKDYPDLHKICLLFQRKELINPKNFRYKPLTGYLQEGPQCGLVALAIARGDPSKDKVDKLFALAGELGFSYSGELCSAYYMKHLCKMHLEGTGFDVELYKGRLDTDEIKAFLLRGGMILVPYDSDTANNPGFQNGHRAHWAVISGVIETEDNFYVVARHGKAKNVAVWQLKEIADSNAQLNEFSPIRQQSDKPYRVPEGGLAGPSGLKLKAVLLSEAATSTTESAS